MQVALTLSLVCARGIGGLSVSYVGGLGYSESIELSDSALIISYAAKDNSAIGLATGTGDNDITVSAESASDLSDESEEEESACGKNTRLVHANEGTSSGVLSGIAAGDINHSINVYVSTHTGAAKCNKNKHKEINKSYCSAKHIMLNIIRYGKRCLDIFYYVAAHNSRHIKQLKEIVN